MSEISVRVLWGGLLVWAVIAVIRKFYRAQQLAQEFDPVTKQAEADAANGLYDEPLFDDEVE